MFTSRVKKQIQALLFGGLMVALVTLACESEVAIDLLQPTPTPMPTSEPTVENTDPNYVLALPQEMKSSPGWTFTIKQVTLLEAIDTPVKSHVPQEGIYLWLIGAIGNFADQRECVRSQEFVLSDGEEHYMMQVEDAEAIHQVYNLPYPDFFLGHCLDAGQTTDTFLIFDVSRESMDLWLKFGESQSRLGRLAALIAATPEPDMSAPKLEVQPTFAPAPAKAMVTAGGSNVNIRQGPGTNYEIIGGLRAGQSLEIVGRNADSSWWQVSTPNGLGWVSGRVTTASNVNESIPVR